MQETHIKENIQTWNAIASSFDATRKKPWSIVLDFIKTVSPNERLIDLGCGNGRHLVPAAPNYGEIYGYDFSKKLLKITNKKIMRKNISNASLIQGILEKIPCKTNTFDVCICIAAIHNIKGRTNRQQACAEIYRILKPESVGLISVWSRWQDRFRNHFLNQEKNIKHDFGDIILNWQLDNIAIPRFYHLYSQDEFKQDLLSAKLHIDKIQAVKLASNHYADNYFAYVSRKE